ncbi:MAG: tRNA threonylcarbamoyladenosine dehydratase [Bacilli bacterium]|nr:tRNA threonylcarbamoyladenosine dehydratase [Bacilli bacterium]
MQELSRLELLVGEEKVQKLREKTVLILGLGGVGGYVLEMLARSGIGKFIIVDGDIVDRSNINRQIIALENTIGEDKVKMWKNRIQDILPSTKVIAIKETITEENIHTIFEYPIDYAIDACDTVTTKFAFLKYCIKKQIPFLTCLGTGKRIDPSKLVITDLSKTEYDPLAKILRKKVKDEKIKEKIPVVFSREIPKKIEGKTIASSAFVPSSAGILAASYVFQKLLEENKIGRIDVKK